MAKKGNIIAWLLVAFLVCCIAILVIGYIILLSRLREDSGQITSPLEVHKSVKVVYDTSGWQEYSNSTHGVTIKYPNDFETPTVKLDDQGEEYLTFNKTIHIAFSKKPKSECTAGCPDYTSVIDRTINAVPVTIYEGFYPAPPEQPSKVKTELYEVKLKDGIYLQIHYGIAENDYVEISETKKYIEQMVATLDGVL